MGMGPRVKVALRYSVDRVKAAFEPKVLGALLIHVVVSLGIILGF